MYEVDMWGISIFYTNFF